MLKFLASLFQSEEDRALSRLEGLMRDREMTDFVVILENDEMVHIIYKAYSRIPFFAMEVLQMVPEEMELSENPYRVSFKPHPFYADILGEKIAYKLERLGFTVTRSILGTNKSVLEGARNEPH